MSVLKLAAAFSSRRAAESIAGEGHGHLLCSTRDETAHLPFAALYVGVMDDLESLQRAADAGTYLVCERSIRNQPLSELRDEGLPGSVGVFTMVANPSMGPLAADRHWRDRHAPLALKVHVAMTHYYQLSVVHRFTGPDWNGFALCCFATEEDLRLRFFDSKEGERQVGEDVARFADTKRSPRRVITDIRWTG